MLGHDEGVVTLPIGPRRQPAPFEHRQRNAIKSEQRDDDNCQRNDRPAHSHARQHVPLPATESNEEQTAHGEDVTS